MANLVALSSYNNNENNNNSNNNNNNNQIGTKTHFWHNYVLSILTHIHAHVSKDTTFMFTFRSYKIDCKGLVTRKRHEIHTGMKTHASMKKIYVNACFISGLNSCRHEIRFPHNFIAYDFVKKNFELCCLLF